MASQLEGKVAVITGGGMGIGRGIARRFVREGAAVVVAEINDAAGRSTVAELEGLGGRAHFIPTDVSRKGDVEAAIAAAVDQFGSLDILVNNAVRLPTPVTLAIKTDEMLAEQLQIGIWGAWWGMRAAMPVMRARGRGRIINLTSMDVDSGAWLHADYSIAKAGIMALTRSAAIDWARYGITVNALAPIAATTAFEQMCKDRSGLREAAGAAVPVGRMGDPEQDIAPAAVFLATDDAAYITGVSIPVDGGLSMPRGNSTPADFSMFGE